MKSSKSIGLSTGKLTCLFFYPNFILPSPCLCYIWLRQRRPEVWETTKSLLFTLKCSMNYGNILCCASAWQRSTEGLCIVEVLTSQRWCREVSTEFLGLLGSGEQGRGRSRREIVWKLAQTVAERPVTLPGSLLSREPPSHSQNKTWTHVSLGLSPNMWQGKLEDIRVLSKCFLNKWNKEYT